VKTENSLALAPTSMARGESPLCQQLENATKSEIKCSVDSIKRKTTHAIRSNNHQSLSKTTVSKEISRKPLKVPLKLGDVKHVLHMKHTTRLPV